LGFLESPVSVGVMEPESEMNPYSTPIVVDNSTLVNKLLDKISWILVAACVAHILGFLAILCVVQDFKIAIMFLIGAIFGSSFIAGSFYSHVKALK